MYESQRPGMECLTRTYGKAVLYELLIFAELCAAQDLVPAITFVVEKRMADMLHVGTDLMGTSGFQPAFHERDIIEILQYAIVGDGMFPDSAVRWKYCHLHPVFRVTGDVAFDTSFFILKASPDQSIVQPLGGFVEELLPQMRFGIGIFGHYEKSGGVLVYAVYQSHCRVVRVIVRIVLQVPGDGID